MKRYKCRYVDNGIDFEKKSVAICCKMPHQRSEDILLVKNYHGGAIDWNELFSVKAKIREDLRQGNVSSQCNGCYYLKELEDSEEYEIKDNFDTIVLNHFEKCNSLCFYCTKVHNPLPDPEYNFLPVFKDMVAKKLITDDIFVFFGGGEPTLLKEFEKLLEEFFKNKVYNCIIHSSGIKFSPAIAKGLKNKQFEVITSIDSGTRETYKKIKSVDCFDRVCDNLKKYVKASHSKDNVKLKYIITPGYNDTIEEIDKWYEIAVKKIGIKFIILDLEFEYYAQNVSNISPHILNMIEYIKNKAKVDNIRLHFYDQLLQVLAAKE